MIKGKFKTAVVLTMSAMVLGGCIQKPEPKPEDEKHANQVPEVMYLEDYKLLEKAVESLTPDEKKAMTGQPEIETNAKFTKNLEKTFEVSTKAEKPLRIVYVPTSDEDSMGKLYLYAVGDDFQDLPHREEVLLATEDRMEKMMESSNSLEDFEAQLKERKIWSTPILNHSYPLLNEEEPKETKEAKETEEKEKQPDVAFYQMEKDYYVVYHERNAIKEEHKLMDEGRVWTAEKIEKEFGDLVGDIPE